MTPHDEIPLKMTMVDHLLPEDRIVQLQGFIEAMASIRSNTAQSLHMAGTSLDAGIAGHPLEARIKTVLVEPLHRDALALLRLFDQIETRLRLFMPAPSLAQFLAGLELQNADVQAKHSIPAAPAPQSPAAPAPEPEMLTALHRSISHSKMALSLSASAFKDRERHNGSLRQCERDAMEAIAAADASIHAAQLQLDAYRRQAAEHGGASVDPQG